MNILEKINKMTEEARASDKALGVPLVPIKEIYLDHEFNCRGFFSPTECIELAEDIAFRGLLTPVIVRPLREEDKDNLKNEGELLDKGFKYNLLVGYRRLYSYQINETDVIPVIIKEAYISNFKAHDLNTVENIHRKDLNLYQEARAIAHYHDANWTIQECSDKIRKSNFWVQQRYRLLEMPDEVQEAAAQGWVKPSDIGQLTKIKDPTELLKTVGIIRGKRKRGDNRNVFSGVKVEKNKDSKKQRKRDEIFEMIEHISSTFKHVKRDKHIQVMDFITIEGYSLMTRLLSWSAGEISLNELKMSIHATCKIFDIFYEGDI